MKKNNYFKSGPVVPQSFITKDRQRLKQYFDTVYLKNGDEFEIEIFNPKQIKVLAKIELNGVSFGNGIVLRPGERIFLERFLDDAKKFKFDTYFVDGDIQDVLNAISKNGDVIIKFYDENLPYLPSYSFGTNSTNIVTPLHYGYSTNTLSGYVTINTSYTTTPLETGRVEKGTTSNQKFDDDNTMFELTPSATNWWKIRPKSTKPIESTDLTIYCTECGSKRKKPTFKYCPHCGTKY